MGLCLPVAEPRSFVSAPEASQLGIPAAKRAALLAAWTRFAYSWALGCAHQDAGGAKGQGVNEAGWRRTEESDVASGSSRSL